MEKGSINKISELLKVKARETGFEMIGITPAEALPENGRIIKEWCDAGMNAGMGYMDRNIEKRTDPRLLLENTRSVIVTGINYYSERKQGGGDVPVISRYVYGKDYHEVIMAKLESLIDYLLELVPGERNMAFVDSGTVMEKAWAIKAGLGWQGRHSIIVNPHFGSFIFLGVILTTAILDYDSATEDRCGECRLCVDACPTQAINSNRTIDARRCISYFTIDNRAPVPDEKIPMLRGRIAGCDICQEVCPWNSKAVQHNHPEFNLSDALRTMSADDWMNLSEEDHLRLFGHSALSRRKYAIFKENVTNVTNWLRRKENE